LQKHGKNNGACGSAFGEAAHFAGLLENVGQI
jgi:hypothetical protein